MKVKEKEIKWDVVDEASYHFEPDQFDTKKDAMEFINEKSFGKHFVLYRTTIKRRLVKKINKFRPRPCVGGWYNGHSISEQDAKNEVKNPYCSHCGYKLKRVNHLFGETSFVAVKPLMHKEDKK